ncbi:HAD-IA family hydrolase [Candidatus Poribacteria bacterium]|nr:HAD-IA family hydrolase [Candidatus Poribacteria bacterium]MYH81515.1 HAD-IA family hydrolase [Candidatus Poribacteria bacterium]MYK92637.1 HAD-IA family hydrolase [Candidatus Poribacteria bacterium]
MRQLKPPVQAIIFDFDYTLADSSEGIIECINFALDRLSLPLAADAEIRKTIGLSLPDALVMLVGKEYVQHTDEFTRLFVERADEVMTDMTELFDIVPETVAALQKLGIRLGIVTLKYRYRIESVLRREQLTDAFEVIIGFEDVSEQKPNPTGLLTAVEKLECVRQNCFYVGDSLTDAKTAQQANIDFIAVLSGVTPRAAFEDYDVYAVLKDVSELLNLGSVRR